MKEIRSVKNKQFLLKKTMKVMQKKKRSDQKEERPIL